MKIELQIQARLLRQQGKSIKSISKELSVSASSVSRWCRDIALSNEQKESLQKTGRESALAALEPWIQRNRKLKEGDIAKQGQRGAEDVGTLTERDQFMLGLGLYWGEGYKRGSQEWGFTNSDPLIIRTMLHWLSNKYDVGIDRITARLTINSLYLDMAQDLTLRWSQETGIPVHQFATPSIIESKGSVGRNPQTYWGTLRIKVRSGTSLRRRILASIDCAGNQSSSCSLNTAS